MAEELAEVPSGVALALKGFLEAKGRTGWAGAMLSMSFIGTGDGRR